MAPSISLRGILVISCILTVLSLTQALDTLYVKPTSDTWCDEDPCLTLMEYADNSSQYFTRDTETVFMTGRHLLGRTIVVSNIAVFIMHKAAAAFQSHPEIVCTAAVGIVFVRVTNVSISELSFVSCGDVVLTAPIAWVLYASSVGLFVMANATVKEAHATAVVARESTFYSFDNCFQDNAGRSSIGGAIFALRSNVSIDNSQFYNNSAFENGGAIDVFKSVIIFSGLNIFAGNKAFNGGSIFIADSVAYFKGNHIFMHNSATQTGGAIASETSVLDFSGNTTFVNNSAISSVSLATAALSSLNDTMVSFTGNTTFRNNGPSRNTLVFAHCKVAIEGVFNFEYNQGGISALNANITIKGVAIFINNSATFLHGNALSLLDNSTLKFNGTALFSGNSPIVEIGFGTVYIASSTLQFTGYTSFISNTDNAGAAILAAQATIKFDGTQLFERNVASQEGGAIYVLDSTVKFRGCSSFINNSAGIQGGAISNVNGRFHITGNATFTGNQARFGGGLYIEYISQLLLLGPLELSFQHNSAEKGGAIYINDVTNTILCFNDSILNIPTAIASCFIISESLSDDIQLDFSSNTASQGGESVFGGMLDKCVVNDNLVSPVMGLSLLTNFSTISSEPLRLCFCVNGKENCAYDPPLFRIVRGATVSVSAVALDQVNRTVAATIRSYYPYNNETVNDFRLGERVQQIEAMCTPINYTILTTASCVTFILYPEGPCRDIGNSQRQIHVCLLPCPMAFELSDTQCICEKRLQLFTNSCIAENQTFSRSTNFWVGTEYIDGNYTGLILHPHCPLDYCTGNPADISVNDLDSQCGFNRSGILCGSCQQNLSLAMGSSQCLQCSNSYLVLLLPFAVAGIVLVFVLFILKLTVSKGTLSGLIFYANIIAVNKEIFFPSRTSNILTVFIAWLNLDLGIETCFFDGMDTYTRTWLQYIFPFYIWLLVFILVVVSHYSVRVPKLLGRNPTAVLTTLFLLSYAKLLRTIIASFSATALDYPGNSTDTVWLYDGNIRFLRGKHIPLFLFSLLVLLFLFLPYTVLLFLSQWLQALSNSKLLFWMNNLRLKTFLDAYHAPYNINHRYWTGLLLLLRCVLFLVFASNTSGDPSVNLLAITSVSLGLAVLTHLTGQVYSNWWLDVLEFSFILNLGIIAAATYYVLLSGGSQSTVAYLSVSVALTEFAGIIIWHVFLQLKDTSMWNSAIQWIHKLYTYTKCWKTEEHEEPPTPSEEQVIQKPPSTTFIELREPMLDFPS